MTQFAYLVLPHILPIPQESAMVVKGVTVNDSRQKTHAGQKPCKEAKEVPMKSEFTYFGWFLLLTKFSLTASWQSHPRWGNLDILIDLPSL